MADSNTYFNGFIKEYENISEKYEIRQRLGRGAFADVMLVKDLETNKFKAVKVMQLVSLNTTNGKSDNNIKKLQREALLISQLNHPNILKFYECFQFANNFCIVCEYCEEDLTKVLQNHVINRTRPDKKLAIKWFYDLSRGLKYLHDKKIIHRDIKPSNILFKDKEIKIGDFGESKQILQTMTMMTICGTPQYMSPELFRKSEYFTYKTDVWSLGCVFYEIYYLEPAFVGESLNEVKRNVLNRKISYLHNRQNDVTVFQILIDKMLCIDEEQRLSIIRVLSNELFTDYQTDDIKSTSYENIEHPYMEETKKSFHPTDTTNNSTNTVKTKKIFPTIEEYNSKQDNYNYPLETPLKIGDFRIFKDVIPSYLISKVVNNCERSSVGKTVRNIWEGFEELTSCKNKKNESKINNLVEKNDSSVFERMIDSKRTADENLVLLDRAINQKLFLKEMLQSNKLKPPLNEDINLVCLLKDKNKV